MCLDQKSTSEASQLLAREETGEGCELKKLQRQGAWALPVL